MKHHPYTEFLPLMGEEAFKNLKADIRLNGLRLPVLTYKGQVLDGRNRERACEETGVEIRYEAAVDVATDEDAIALILSLNSQRRELTRDQRAQAASKLANIINGHGRCKNIVDRISTDILSVNTEADASHQPVTMVAAARVMNVPVIRVHRMRAVEKYGKQVAVDEVLSGKVSLDAQYNKFKPSRDPKPQRQKRGKPGRPRKDEVQSTPRLAVNNDAPAKAPVYEMPKYLSPAEVDPEFKGTPTEFVSKYGYVQVNTAAEFASMRFSDWAGFFRSLAKYARGMPPLPERPVDHNWLRNPPPGDVAKLDEALAYLRPLVTEAEALLVTAKAALESKKVSNG